MSSRGTAGDSPTVQILSDWEGLSRTYLEITAEDTAALVAELRALDIVRGLEVAATLKRIYGKRIIIMGGGAQVGQVGFGAISEADRHNIRGEQISVDTIPLVGEEGSPAPCAPWRGFLGRATSSWPAR